MPAPSGYRPPCKPASDARRQEGSSETTLEPDGRLRRRKPLSALFPVVMGPHIHNTVEPHCMTETKPRGKAVPDSASQGSYRFTIVARGWRRIHLHCTHREQPRTKKR